MIAHGAYIILEVLGEDFAPWFAWASGLLIGFLVYLRRPGADVAAVFLGLFIGLCCPGVLLRWGDHRLVDWHLIPLVCVWGGTVVSIVRMYRGSVHRLSESETSGTETNKAETDEVGRSGS